MKFNLQAIRNWFTKGNGGVNKHPIGLVDPSEPSGRLVAENVVAENGISAFKLSMPQVVG